jgi:predicted dehydrogenase
MINLLLIGSGNWGKIYISTIKKDFPYIHLTIANRNNWQELIQHADGVIIATPPEPRISIAENCLKLHKPILLEKPLSLSFLEAQKLKEYKDNIIFINYIHIFSDPWKNILSKVQDVRKIFSSGLGDRVSNGCTTLNDWGSHDIAMILDLLKKSPQKINIEQISKDCGEYYKLDMIFDNCETTSVFGYGSLAKKRNINIIDKHNIIFKYNDKIECLENRKPLNNIIYEFCNNIRGQELISNKYLDLGLQVSEILEKCEEQLKYSI